MTSGRDPVAEPSEDGVVIASFGSARHAERMLASLGSEFRRNARRHRATVVVVTGNADGSLKLRQSHVVTASGLASALIRVFLAWTVGFMGLISTLKGAKGVIHAAAVREGHVGSDAHRAQQVLAEAGPGAALTLVRCAGRKTQELVADAAAARATRAWDGATTELLAALDPGSRHDWVRTAIGQPPAA
jgi:uncharacterized membrane protein